MQKQMEQFLRDPQAWLRPSIQQPWWGAKMIKSWYQPLIMSLEMQGEHIAQLENQLREFREHVSYDKYGGAFISPASLAYLRKAGLLPEKKE
jgi:hypothetical protein